MINRSIQRLRLLYPVSYLLDNNHLRNIPFATFIAILLAELPLK